jgi:hypothetical protein
MSSYSTIFSSNLVPFAYVFTLHFCAVSNVKGHHFSILNTLLAGVHVLWCVMPQMGLFRRVSPYDVIQEDADRQPFVGVHDVEGVSRASIEKTLSMKPKDILDMIRLDEERAYVQPLLSSFFLTHSIYLTIIIK